VQDAGDMNQRILDELNIELDDNTAEPSRQQLVVAVILGSFWLGLFPGAHMFPAGFFIAFLQLRRFTGVHSLKGRLKYGKKALLAAALGAAVGYVLKAGLMLHFTKDGSLQFDLSIL
jgi:hypothetical protein